METINVAKIKTVPHELTTILADALVISQQSHLKEICTEALLYAILENEKIAARLLKCGLNIFMYKRQLAVRLKMKAISNPPAEPPHSVALQGLLILNGMENGNSHSAISLLKTIIKNNNTAAARLLKAERIAINDFNELVYKPTLN